jgi:peptidoglycan/LPS O-acetylase OafA/YrhL
MDSERSRRRSATRIGGANGTFILRRLLTVEEHFYLLWPFTLTVVRSSTARAAVALAFCALLPALRFAEIAADPSMHYPAHIVSHLRIDSLLWGALAAIGLRSRWLADLPRRLLLAAAVATVVALRNVSTT